MTDTTDTKPKAKYHPECTSCGKPILDYRWTDAKGRPFHWDCKPVGYPLWAW